MARPDSADANKNTSAGAASAAKNKTGRAPLACAECRRLKLRCDRQLPCENCTKRGCAVICPDGTLTAGRGNRLVLANTEELHDKITSLMSRVRQLEEALRGCAPWHALLRAELVDPKASSGRACPRSKDGGSPESSGSSGQEVDEVDDVLDAFGTLSIGAQGEAHFLGSTAKADLLLANSHERQPPANDRRLPPEFYKDTWPEAPPSNDDLLPQVLQFLPPLEETNRILDVYFSRHFCCGMFTSREQMRDEVIPRIYSSRSLSLRCCGHKLSLLLSSLALGTLWDPALTASTARSRADDWYQLARAALASKSIVFEATPYAVLALLQIARYVDLSDRESGGSERAWVIVGTAVKVGLSMGLHRDCTRWNLDPSISDRRRATFWQLYIVEALISMQFGRPPAISLAFVDTTVPKDMNDRLDEKGAMQPCFNTWVIQYCIMLRSIAEEAFAARPPPYKAMLALDLRIREFAVPPALAFKMPGEAGYVEADADVPTETMLQRLVVMTFKETIILYLHRSFLLQALMESPKDVLKHKYAASVMACYRSAYRQIEAIDLCHKKSPDVVRTVCCFASTATSCAMIMCLFVMRAPMCTFAPQAKEKLFTACDLLEAMSERNAIAARNLTRIRTMREVAGRVMTQDGLSKVCVEELERVSGRTRLLTLPALRLDDGAGAPGGMMMATLQGVVANSRSMAVDAEYWKAVHDVSIGNGLNGGSVTAADADARASARAGGEAPAQYERQYDMPYANGAVGAAGGEGHAHDTTHSHQYAPPPPYPASYQQNAGYPHGSMDGMMPPLDAPGMFAPPPLPQWDYSFTGHVGADANTQPHAASDPRGPQPLGNASEFGVSWDDVLRPYGIS